MGKCLKDLLQVVELAAGGIRVDLKSLLKLLHIALLHGHLPLNQQHVLKRQKRNPFSAFF